MVELLVLIVLRRRLIRISSSVAIVKVLLRWPIVKLLMRWWWPIAKLLIVCWWGWKWMVSI